MNLAETKIDSSKRKEAVVTEDHATRILKRHSSQWHNLVKIPVALWQQIFIYSRLDIISESNI